MNPASILCWLDGFDIAGDGASEKSIELVRMLLLYSPEPLSRNQFTPGHITATACVLHPNSQRFLLIHHKRLDRWLMPGGHVEIADAGILESAAREAVEETSIQLANIPAHLVSVDVHAIPPNKSEPLHLHHDLTFCFRAASETVMVTTETKGVVWATSADFERYRLAVNLQRAARRSMQIP